MAWALFFVERVAQGLGTGNINRLPDEAGLTPVPSPLRWRGVAAERTG
jgi:hypothetical protein